MRFWRRSPERTIELAKAEFASATACFHAFAKTKDVARLKRANRHITRGLRVLKKAGSSVRDKDANALQFVADGALELQRLMDIVNVMERATRPIARSRRSRR